MKCHYEILGIKRDVGEDEIKKAYRKLALKWHPDKNLKNPDEAKEQFQLIQQAYDVLSDSHERAWYDNHREAILKGGVGENYKDDSIDLFRYFTTTCYRSYNDEEKGFYTVYRGVFETLYSEDTEFMRSSESEDDAPPTFGDSQSPYDPVVHTFYAYWQSYSTRRSFAWLDPYDIRDAPNRRVLRCIEKENKKIRERAKRERNEQVRNLVAFVRKRDKRVQANAERMAARARENAKKAQQRREEKLLERRAELKNYKTSDWSNVADVENELRNIESSLAKEFGDERARDNDEIDSDGEFIGSGALYCVACNKIFKTQKAFGNHENSRKHRDNFLSMKSSMVEEEETYCDDVEFGGSNEGLSGNEGNGARGPEMPDFLIDPVKKDFTNVDETSEDELYSDSDEDSDESTKKNDFKSIKAKVILNETSNVKEDLVDEDERKPAKKNVSKAKKGKVALNEVTKVKEDLENVDTLKSAKKSDFKSKKGKMTSKQTSEVNEDLDDESSEKSERNSGIKAEKGKMTLNEVAKVKEDLDNEDTRKSTKTSDSKGKKGKMTLNKVAKVKEDLDNGDTRKSTKTNDSKDKKGKMTLNEVAKVKEDLDNEDTRNSTKTSDSKDKQGKMTLNETSKVREDIENEVSKFNDETTSNSLSNDLYVYPEGCKLTENEDNDGASSDELISDQEDETTERLPRKKKKKVKMIMKVNARVDSEEENFDIDAGLSKKQRRRRRNIEELTGRKEQSEIIDDLEENDQETRIRDEAVEILVTETLTGKTRGKRAKEMRKAQKLQEKDDGTRVQRGKRENKNSEMPDVEHQCVTCKSEFSSKNKLFDHLKKTGHSVYLPSVAGRTKKNNEKKSRGRARSDSD